MSYRWRAQSTTPGDWRFSDAAIAELSGIDLSAYTLISGVAAAGDVRAGVPRYAGGPKGSMPYPSITDGVPDIAEIIRDWICSDPLAVARLARFDFGDGISRPAIFTRDPAPIECFGPHATIAITNGREIGNRNSPDFEHAARVIVWGERRGSSKDCRKAAMALFEALRRGKPAIDGYVIHIYADPPGDVSDGDGYPGFAINTRVQIREENLRWR